MIQLLRYFSLINICLILAGCKYHVIKYFNFEDFKTSYSWGSVGGRFLGAPKLLNDADADRINTEVIGPPYELLLEFSLDHQKTTNIESCEVLVQSLKVISTTNQKIVFTAANHTEHFFIAADNGNDAAFFSFPDLALEYTDHYVDVDFTVPGTCFKNSRDNGGQSRHLNSLLKGLTMKRSCPSSMNF